jgi:hypothetical protein
MVLTYLNLKTSASWIEEYEHFSSEPLVTLHTDLLKGEHVTFDYDNESWFYFKSVLESIKDKDDNGLEDKVLRAIRRRLKGTSQGIQVIFRDEQNLVWHVIVTFVESLTLKNN